MRWAYSRFRNETSTDAGPVRGTGLPLGSTYENPVPLLERVADQSVRMVC